MPGKRVGEYSWRYLTAAAINRVVDSAAADANILPATVEAVAESLDNADGAVAYENVLDLVAILDATVTSADISIFVDLAVLDENGAAIPGAERWCFLSTHTVTQSTVLPVSNVPPGILKFMVTSAAGSGNVRVGAMLPK